MSIAVTAFRDDIAGVPDDALLYRRVDWDKIGGKARAPKGIPASLNGNCFTDYSEAKAREKGLPGPCMSVCVATILDQHKRSASSLLQGFSDYGLAWIRAGDLRKLTRLDGSPCFQGIMLDPTDDEPWHGVVFDLTRRPRPKPVCKAISLVSDWVIPLINHGE